LAIQLFAALSYTGGGAIGPFVTAVMILLPGVVCSRR